MRCFCFLGSTLSMISAYHDREPRAPFDVKVWETISNVVLGSPTISPTAGVETTLPSIKNIGTWK